MSGQVTYQPRLAYRVLATHWEAEHYTECWTETRESAETIAAALRTGHGDTSVQIDEVRR